MCSLVNHIVRLIAVTGKKSIDETTAARDLDGSYVRWEAHAADKCLSRSQALHNVTSSLCNACGEIDSAVCAILLSECVLLNFAFVWRSKIV
jgi:hypothetical protein